MGCFDFIVKALVIGLFISFLGFQSCSSNEEPETEAVENVSSESDLTNAIPFQEKELIYAWVDKLSVRDTPSLKGKLIASLKTDDALEVTGEKSEQTEIIVLRGMVYNEPWINVTMPDGSNGWVYGGAVKHKDESKGNELITNQKFDFPYFGKYNLTSWEKSTAKDESGGDAEIETTVYKKDNQTLEVSIVEVGEYGYSRYYTLKDENGKVLKERAFNFSADIKEMTETVKDFTTSTLYERKQKIGVHYAQLNAKPVMVNGSWNKSELKEET